MFRSFVVFFCTRGRFGQIFAALLDGDHKLSVILKTSHTTSTIVRNAHSVRSFGSNNPLTDKQLLEYHEFKNISYYLNFLIDFLERETINVVFFGCLCNVPEQKLFVGY